jgi:hypothetical protein
MAITGSFNERANANDTSNATLTVIAAATGRRWEIGTLVVSALDAGNFSLLSGANVLIGPIYTPANTTHTFDLADCLRCNPGESFVLSKGTAAHDYTVFCQYRDMG